jgi:dihydrofolate reductase
MILLHVAMSLDGFIAGPGHDMSWTGGAEYDTSSQLADEVARGTGVVLAGRGWYEVASADEAGAVAGIYGGAWSGPVIVLTHHPERLASDPTVVAVSDLGTALAQAEELADGRAVSIFGADVARQVLALGRLDEIIVQIVPLILGDGVRLFGEPPTPSAELKRTYLGTSGPLTDVRFQVAAAPPSEFSSG